MKTIYLAATAAALVLAAAVPTYAEPGHKPLQLIDGSVYDNPGKMFQHLRDREDGFAAGNPKAIVDAYPDEFENVGDLIQQKREAAE